MQSSAVHAMLALRRVARGRVFRHDARLFTGAGAPLPGYITDRLPGLLAEGYLNVDAAADAGAADRGALQVTDAGAAALSEWEREWALQVAWLRSQHPVLTRTAAVVSTPGTVGIVGGGWCVR